MEYPQKIDPIKSLLDDASDNVRVYYAKKEFGENFQLYQQLKKVVINSGIQAKMPFEINIK